jgi:translation initiation factor 2 alpha subunit (eIF-2alpha)
MEYEQGDTLLCTVDRIMGTTVFVIMPNGKEGTIVLSEIAPGRIRNLRDHVVPKKSIVCKVLKSHNGNVHLSLRRVSLKEKKEVLEKEKQEKSYKAILKTILKEDAQKVIQEIKKENPSIYEFLQEAKENINILEKITNKENAKKIIDIVSQQKQKTFIIKKQIKISSESSEGLELIKKIFSKVPKDYQVKYISAGKYTIKKETQDLKKSDKEIKEILENLEKFAKSNDMEFSVK